MFDPLPFGNAATDVHVRTTTDIDGITMTANDIFDLFEYSTSRFIAIHKVIVNINHADRPQYETVVGTALSWEVEVGPIDFGVFLFMAFNHV